MSSGLAPLLNGRLAGRDWLCLQTKILSLRASSSRLSFRASRFNLTCENQQIEPESKKAVFDSKQVELKQAEQL